MLSSGEVVVVVVGVLTASHWFDVCGMLEARRPMEEAMEVVRV